ncbi:Endo-beta-1,4-xylanase Xyn10C precursor [Planctomycetes bacterium CA13]|uniref:Beta-xylanase n=1 Tax=Novipirellula herctigrandis TaxID=2527986 RepID=A0A5C5Z0G4_9BACT|nr:Endo-beta-1,4-xylanase Xyn10C precursor [Planctomycetes bacterium CA13]
MRCWTSHLTGSSRLFLAFLFFCGGGLVCAEMVTGPLAHRKSSLTVSVEDAQGNPLSQATINVRMTRHAFQFGTQVKDRLFTISESEFNGLSETQKQNLLPNLTSIGVARYTPTWQDTVNYRTTVLEQFNHIVPTNGMQWTAYNNSGPNNPDAAINVAYANGMTAKGHSVVWQKDGWPTPNEFRSASSPTAQGFHDALINDRLSSGGIMARYSSTGAGPNITTWDVLNEPLHEDYYMNTFVDADIYQSNVEAMADYFIRAKQIRPDAILVINDYNILSSQNDNNAIAYRNLINDLQAAGAEIDRIGVQAHVGFTSLSKEAIDLRLDIIAETGLAIEITEFDIRDDVTPVSATRQAEIFEDMLTSAFEHESVMGFNMWGFWDPGHWRGNGPLFDEDWVIKEEASPWFDLVQGEWKPELFDLTLDGQGQWMAPEGLFNGTYEIEAMLDGQMASVSGFQLLENGQITLRMATAVPEPSTLALTSLVCGMLSCRRHRKRKK